MTHFYELNPKNIFINIGFINLEFIGEIINKVISATYRKCNKSTIVKEE